jgi:NDP-sugar pyrophosphorylase family protein
MQKYRAFLLSSGLGTRLLPLTEKIPKPLVPIFHKPLLTFALDHFLALGIDQIGINTRYLWESFYREFQVETKKECHHSGDSGFYEGHPLSFFKEPSYLDTGGSLRHARDFLEQGTFLIHNGDILTNIPLQELVQQHHHNGAIATLLLRETGGALNVCYDEKSNRVLDIRGNFHHPEFPLFLYCGIAAVEPTIFNFIAPEGPVSLIDALLSAMKAGYCVRGFVSRSGFWSDIGTPEAYLKTHLELAQAPWKFHYALRGADSWPQGIHPTATIDPSAKLVGTVVVGAHAHIEKNATVNNSVLLPGAIVKSDSIISDTVII